MEILIELVFDLLFEGGLEITQNKHLSKWIRYPILFGIILFFIATIGLIVFLGILFWNKNKLVSVFLLIVAIFLFIGSILKFREIYLTKHN